MSLIDVDFPTLYPHTGDRKDLDVLLVDREEYELLLRFKQLVMSHMPTLIEIRDGNVVATMMV